MAVKQEQETVKPRFREGIRYVFDIEKRVKYIKAEEIPSFEGVRKFKIKELIDGDEWEVKIECGFNKLRERVFSQKDLKELKKQGINVDPARFFRR